MKRIGILAYGSLIDNPGPELGPNTAAKIKDVNTPFDERKKSRRSLVLANQPAERKCCIIESQMRARGRSVS